MNRAQRMMIHPGIKGINREIAADKAGWHITVNDRDVGYTELGLTQALAYYARKGDVKLAGVTGNGMAFTTHPLCSLCYGQKRPETHRGDLCFAEDN